MDLLQVVVLALLQGLTEFLPISSSAHLVLPALLSEWPDQGLVFDIAVHAGSLLAVLWYFRADLDRFVTSAWQFSRHGVADDHARLLGRVLIATLPIVVLGYLLHDWVEMHAREVLVIATTTIGFAVLLWIADRRVARPGRSEFQLSLRDALLIGGMQVLAIVPGTSRSGITITAALLLGLSREASARFAFLLAIPTILGAATLATLDAIEGRSPVPWRDVLLGFALSAVASYVAMHYFVKLIERTGMLPYVVYRLILGGALLIVGLGFSPQPT